MCRKFYYLQDVQHGHEWLTHIRKIVSTDPNIGHPLQDSSPNVKGRIGKRGSFS